jgi:hypothetical protein
MIKLSPPATKNQQRKTKKEKQRGKKGNAKQAVLPVFPYQIGSALHLHAYPSA